MKFRFSKAILVKVLAFTALSAVMTGVLAIKIGNLKLFSHTYGLEAVFSDATGVFKGDAVKLAGVDVGRVTGADIEHGQAVVSFSVDDQVKLAKDSVVALRWRNVLGQRFLYVYPGDDHSHPLMDGDRIPLRQTENAGDLGDFLNKLGPILQAIDPDEANAFIDAVNTALAGNEAAVTGLVANGATLASDLAGRDEEIKSLIESSSIVLDTYASQDEQVRAILDDLDNLSTQLNGMTGDINTFLQVFPDVQEQLDRLLKTNRTSIDQDLSDLDVTAGVLRDNRANLETTLCTLPAGLAGYFQTTSWGQWFNVRVVEVMLKDSSGRTVADVGELPIQTNPKAPAPYTKCAGGVSQSSGKSSKHAPPPGKTDAQSAEDEASGSGHGAGGARNGFQDVGAFVDWVLGGNTRG